MAIIEFTANSNGLNIRPVWHEKNEWTILKQIYFVGNKPLSEESDRQNKRNKKSNNQSR